MDDLAVEILGKIDKNVELDEFEIRYLICNFGEDEVELEREMVYVD